MLLLGYPLVDIPNYQVVAVGGKLVDLETVDLEHMDKVVPVEELDMVGTVVGDTVSTEGVADLETEEHSDLPYFYFQSDVLFTVLNLCQETHTLHIYLFNLSVFDLTLLFLSTDSLTLVDFHPCSLLCL